MQDFIPERAQRWAVIQNTLDDSLGVADVIKLVNQYAVQLCLLVIGVHNLEIQAYNPESHRWHELGKWLTAHDVTMTAVVHDKLQVPDWYKHPYRQLPGRIYSYARTLAPLSTPLPLGTPGGPLLLQAILAVRDELYCVALHNGAAAPQPVFRYDVTSRTWIPGSAPVPNRRNITINAYWPRSSVQMVTLQEKIYLMRQEGYTNPPADDFECYDTKKDTWSPCAPLSTLSLTYSQLPAMAAGMGFVFCCGGSDLRTFGTLAACSRYDPLQDRWAFMAPLRQNRSSAVAACVDDKLFVCGGMASGLGSIGSAESYDMTLDKWTIVSYMPVPVSTGHQGICHIV